jgi:hypothetical protein
VQRSAIAIALCAAVACSASARAARADVPAPATRWLSLGVLGGSTMFDAHLADYQWDVAPRTSWGVQAMAGSGPFGVGTRVWATQTVQHTGLAIPDGDPTVHATSWDLLGEGRCASVWGIDVLASASVGWLHLAYQPDQLTIPDSGGGPPITVDFRAVNEWIGGGGLGLRHALPGSWSTGVQVERRVFGLDTAHRNGNVIEQRRESFGEWSVRLEVARLYGRR